MSQTTYQAPPVEFDEYLAAQTMPAGNVFEVDPQYHNLRFTTPVGRLPYVHVAQPHAINQPGKPPGKPKFTATLLMSPGTQDKPIILDLFNGIRLVADTHWPYIDRADPTNPGQIIRVKGSDMLFVPPHLGGYHYPLRSGDESYMKEPAKFAAWRGLVFINTSMDPFTKAGMPQRPVYLDEQGNECDPARFYPGCYGRLNVTIAPFENSGNRGVTMFLNVIQFAKHGKRMTTGFDAVKAGKNAMAAAGALPVAEPMPPQAGFPTGYGPNAAGPGSVPPGAVPGFAAPPPPAQQPQYAPQPQYAQPVQQPQYAPQPVQQPVQQPQYAQQPMQQPMQQPVQPGFAPQAPIPPQQPWQPSATGVRPPGV